MRLRCTCGRVLGELAGGRFIMRHHGREIIGPIDAFDLVRCDRCGRAWDMRELAALEGHTDAPAPAAQLQEETD